MCEVCYKKIQNFLLNFHSYLGLNIKKKSVSSRPQSTGPVVFSAVKKKNDFWQFLDKKFFFLQFFSGHKILPLGGRSDPLVKIRF